MAQRGDIPINNFVKGLVTEASPLTFPQGASLDEVNFVLKRDGSRERRLGLDLEENYGLHDLGLSSEVLEGARCQAYRWSIPNGDIEQDIGVIQTGNRIWFIDLYTQNPSANILNGGNPISVTEVDNSVIMTFTTINNYLVGVANQLIQPYLFTYDAATDTVTTETAAIAVRDLWGVDDGLDVNGRPTTLSAAHHYNLLNQGWVPEIQSTCGAGIDAIDCTFNTFGIYPSNSDQWSLGRIEDLTSADVNKFDPNVAARNLVSTGQAPRGHFVIDLFNRGTSRSTQTGLTLPVDRETGRITAIAAYAGRIFYGGILSKVAGGDNRSPNLGGSVLFSQLFENKINLVKCYQEADPTSPDINDIVDTDGGLIQIPECSYIFALKAIRESLFVFAANGVWEIRGGENGFTATSYMVNKISNVGVYAPKSIVEVEGTIFFWAATGIHAIARNENGVFQTSNLTLPTIQTLYNAIPDASKKNARGYHDLSQNRARWLYYSPETKRFGEAIDIEEVPAPEVFLVGTESAVTATSVVEPKIIRLSDTKALVVYRSITGTTVYGRVLTISGNSFTAGSEQTLATETSVQALSLTYLNTNKAILVHQANAAAVKALVLNISGDTITPATKYTVNSEGSSTYATSPIRAQRISASRIIITFRNTDNNKTAVQVLDISASDVITWGTIAKSVGNNQVRQGIAMLSSTTFVLIGNSGTRVSAAVVTLSDTTPTINTAYTFPTTTQLPGLGGYTTTQGYVIPIGPTRVGVVVTLSTTSPTVADHLASFILNVSGTVITSTTILQQTTELGAGNPVAYLYNNNMHIIYRKNGSSPFVGRLLKALVTGETPTVVSQEDLGSDVSYTNPEVDRIIGGKIAVAFESGGSVKVQINTIP